MTGEAIYGTRAWKRDAQGDTLRFTAKGSTVYVFTLQWPTTPFIVVQNITVDSARTEVTLLGLSGPPLPWRLINHDNDLQISVPPLTLSQLPCRHAWVFKITHVLNSWHCIVWILNVVYFLFNSWSNKIPRFWRRVNPFSPIQAFLCVYTHPPQTKSCFLTNIMMLLWSSLHDRRKIPLIWHSRKFYNKHGIQETLIFLIGITSTSFWKKKNHKIQINFCFFSELSELPKEVWNFHKLVYGADKWWELLPLKRYSFFILYI